MTTLLQTLLEAAEIRTYEGWKRAIKKAYPDVWFEGDKDIAQAMVGPKPYKRGETKSVGEWDGEKGEVYKFDDSGKLITEAKKLDLKPVQVGHMTPETLPELKGDVFTMSLRSPVTEALADMLGVPDDGTAYKIRTGFIARDTQNNLLAFAKNKYDLPTQVKNRPKDWLMKEEAEQNAIDAARLAKKFSGELVESIDIDKLDDQVMSVLLAAQGIDDEDYDSQDPKIEKKVERAHENVKFYSAEEALEKYLDYEGIINYTSKILSVMKAINAASSKKFNI